MSRRIGPTLTQPPRVLRLRPAYTPLRQNFTFVPHGTHCSVALAYAAATL
jgi:hypothetical protein